jgi:hypothetical protein
MKNTWTDSMDSFTQETVLVHRSTMDRGLNTVAQLTGVGHKAVA